MDRLERTLHEVKWLSVIVAWLMGMPISYLIFQHLFEPGVIGMDDVVSLGAVLEVTAPMTIGIALCGIILMENEGGFLTLILVGATLWLSILLGNKLGWEAGEVPDTVKWWTFWHPEVWKEMVRHYMHLYTSRYGLGLFVAGVLMGLYPPYNIWLSRRARRTAEGGGAALAGQGRS